MKRMINRKGSAHFEMIISFVFFIGFVLFLFIFLKPPAYTVVSDSMVTDLADSFQYRTSTNLSTFLLRVNYSGVDCFELTLPNELFEYDISLGGSHVSFLNGTSVTSSLSGDDLSVEVSDDFLRVSISSEFTSGSLPLCGIPSSYDIGNVVERQIISADFLNDIETDYDSNYEALKDSFGIPRVLDFSINVTNAAFPIDMSPKTGIPETIEVVSVARVVEVLRSNGQISNDEIIFKIW